MNFHKILVQAAACAALTSAAHIAQAETYNYVVTGATFNASWQMDSEPRPGIIFPDYFFGVRLSGTFPAPANDRAEVLYLGANNNGGLFISDLQGSKLLDARGAVLFTGNESDPVMKLGTYTLTDFEGTATYLVTVSAVPEPASLALMLAGLGLVGFAAKRRAGC